MKTSNKYFLNKERESCEKKTITILKKENGEIVTENKTILEEAKEFYENLYSSISNDESTIENMNYVNDVFGLNVLIENQKEMCEGHITELECLEALKFF